MCLAFFIYTFEQNYNFLTFFSEADSLLGWAKAHDMMCLAFFIYTFEQNFNFFDLLS
jgi:hypothetical protein